MKLSYFLKEKTLRRRDVLYKEGDTADGMYFLREGELELSFKYKREDQDMFRSQFFNTNNITQDLKIAIIGKNEIIGLDDLSKDEVTYRK